VPPAGRAALEIGGAGERADAQFVITGSYLDSARFEGRFERKWPRDDVSRLVLPLEAYSRALEAASLRHRDAPRAADPSRRGQASPGVPVLSRVPMLLMFRASAQKARVSGSRGWRRAVAAARDVDDTPGFSHSLARESDDEDLVAGDGSPA
jgi:hypothetical protein